LVNPDDWRDHTRRLFADPLFVPGTSALVDLRSAAGIARLNSLVVEEMADALHAHGFGAMKIALLPNSAWYSARQHDRLIDTDSLTAIVFADDFAACAWLGVDVHAAQTVVGKLRDGLADDRDGSGRAAGVLVDHDVAGPAIAADLPGASVDSAAASVAAYCGHADEYEAMHATKMFEAVEQFAGSLPQPSLILDVGCGPGRDLARFGAHGHVARGVELNPEFVAKAKLHAPTVECDLREVGFRYPPGMFDGIWASASLVHLVESDTVHVLGQFARLLRPGGKLYACLKSVGETGWLDEPDGRRWYTVWEPDRFADAVADAGFAVDRVNRGVFVEVWATRNP